MIFNNPFKIKIISKLRLEGNVLNLIKSIYENPTTTSTQYGEISNALPLRPGESHVAVQVQRLLTTEFPLAQGRSFFYSTGAFN